jgi:predicted RNA-binding protein YlqC (UPF0109 family)
MKCRFSHKVHLSAQDILKFIGKKGKVQKTPVWVHVNEEINI